MMALPDLHDERARRAWLLALAVQAGASIPEAVGFAGEAEQFVLGEKPAAPADYERKEVAVEASPEAEPASHPVGAEALLKEAHYRVLKAVANSPPKVSNKQIAKLAKVSPGSVSGYLTTLRRAGLVESEGRGLSRSIRAVDAESRAAAAERDKSLVEAHLAEKGVTECPPAYAAPVQGAEPVGPLPEPEKPPSWREERDRYFEKNRGKEGDT